MSFFFLGQSGEAFGWRVCYQRGLPRLVYFVGNNIFVLDDIWVLHSMLVWGRTCKVHFYLGKLYISKILSLIINRPGVAGAVLQSPLSLIHSLIK